MMPKITTISEMQTAIIGFWSDTLPLDEQMIECRSCPNCKKKLTYKGYSNSTEYRAYGICQPCDFAKFFWIERVEVAELKIAAKEAA